MKKRTPVTIKELDVQPISDEDLKAFEATGAGSSDFWSYECTCNSDREVYRCEGDLQH